MTTVVKLSTARYGEEPVNSLVLFVFVFLNCLIYPRYKNCTDCVMVSVCHRIDLHPTQVKLAGTLNSLLEHQSFEAHMINKENILS